MLSADVVKFEILLILLKHAWCEGMVRIGARHSGDGEPIRWTSRRGLHLAAQVTPQGEARAFEASALVSDL